ncbi:MAG: winged helix-turn-helix domain-containing protein [Rubritepida sp.]|nr:winged helix-turn-helix domain-containing protein [Rubritepida sp.]
MPGQPHRIAHELRARIFAGELAAGARLAEIPLAEALGASRTPVRLALAQLEAEGLVLAAPGPALPPATPRLTPPRWMPWPSPPMAR